MLGDGKPVRGEAEAAQPEPEIALPAWVSAKPARDIIRPRIIRPSDAVEAEEPAGLSPLDAGGAARFQRGLLVHALLARLPDIAPEARAGIARKFLTGRRAPEDKIEALIAETLAVLDHPDFAPAFAPGGRAEVAVVADLPELGDGARIHGRIDRLAVTDTEVLAIDFKTNRPAPSRPEDVSPVYIAQMALYRAALAKIFPGKRIAAALVWTEGPSLMRLPGALLDAETARIRPDSKAVRPRRTARREHALTLWGGVPRLNPVPHHLPKDPPMSQPIKVSDSSFQSDVLDATKPVVVDFWAEWCGPCKMIAPALDALAGEMHDKITVAKVNIDENPGIPTKYGVRGVPTLMIFRDGQVAATKVGALPQSKIKEWIESSLQG